MSVKGRKFTGLTGGTSVDLDGYPGTTLQDGDIAIVTAGGVFHLYELDANSGATASPPQIVAPVTDAGLKRWILQRVPSDNSVPVGTILAFMGGYFSSATAGDGFVSVLGNTISEVNAQVNGEGFYVCNGAALNLPGSPIFDGVSRYLPNLTGSRFLMGSTAAGEEGGRLSSSHHHVVDIPVFTSGGTSITIAQMPAHTHTTRGSATHDLNTGFQVHAGGDATAGATGQTGSGQPHTHTINPPQISTGLPTLTENRPLFLSCFYIMKVI